MEILSHSKAKLKPHITASIRTDKYLKGHLMLHFNISGSTLQLWLDKNNSSFTQIDSLLLLKEYFELNTIEELKDIREIDIIKGLLNVN